MAEAMAYNRIEMPELPEVETIVRGLRSPLIGRRFTGVRIGWGKIVATPAVVTHPLALDYHRIPCSQESERMRQVTHPLALNYHRIPCPQESERMRQVTHPLALDYHRIPCPQESERMGQEEFERYLVGREVLDVKRRGKYIICHLSGGGALIFHLRMTGRLQVVSASQPLDRHDHLILSLDDGNELRFNNVRKLGRVYLVRDEDEVVGGLGPEPLDDGFTPTDFADLLSGRRGMIKPLLLNQSFIAGIGNIYANEALFVARIHPKRKADSLTGEEIERLYHAIREVLRQGIENRGTTLRHYRDARGREGRNQDLLQVYGRAGQPCPRCGTPIERTVVGGRGTFFCPKCQRE